MDNNDEKDLLKELVESESIEPTVALNILINAVQSVFDKEDCFNDLDKFLISKSLNCFKEYVDKQEDFLIKGK